MGCIGFLVYRFNAVFNVSKTRAAVVAVLCFIAGCCLIPIGIALASDPTGGFASLYAFTWSAIYGGIWYYKFKRDKRIIERAEATQTQQPVQMEQPMNSQGSRRLFVPPPIDRQ